MGGVVSRSVSLRTSTNTVSEVTGQCHGLVVSALYLDKSDVLTCLE